jgi:hypothetical protein
LAEAKLGTVAEINGSFTFTPTSGVTWHDDITGFIPGYSLPCYAMSPYAMSRVINSN